MNESNVKIKTRGFILSLMLLLIANILMGITLTTLSKNTLREQIDQRMLDISNTAAAQLDGDILKTLTKEDENTAGYQQALATLRSFQDNIELDYIYGIHPEPDGTFTFTIDPAVDNPGEFGAPIKTTEALKAAAKGKAGVDAESYQDAWGRFYSAYSPVFDSEGNVAGVVAVDFNAEWYEGKLNSHKAAAVLLTMTTMAIGIVLSTLSMSQNQRRFTEMLEKTELLDRESYKLDRLIMQNSIKKLDMLPDTESTLLKTLATAETEHAAAPDEFEKLSNNIENVYAKLRKYLKYVESEAYTDATTGVQNKAAYKEAVQAFDEKITAGTAAFSVAFFDINGLKKTYTHCGFEAGDQMLFQCAKLLKTVFGKENVYHITGDEFIVFEENKTQTDMLELFVQFDEKLAEYNSGQKPGEQLSVAKGTAAYNKEKHADYRRVFIDAKTSCDRDKEAYYKRAAK